MEFSAKRVLSSGMTFWLILAGLSIYMIYPLRKSIKMGIDLVGGTYITLEVETEKAVEAELIEKMQAIITKLETANKPMPVAKDVKNMAIELVYDFVVDAKNVAHFLKETTSELQQQIVHDKIIKLSFPDAQAKQIMRDAVERNVEVIRTRVDKIGVSETPVFMQGERNIVVELPDANPAEAKAIIGRAAVLEFKLVERYGKNDEELLYEYDGELPSDLEILPGQMRSSDGRVEGYYVVPKYTDITGRLLRDARPSVTNEGMVVEFEWTPEGGDKFYDLTSKNYRRQLAIILDGVVISAPSIDAAIRTSGHIRGGFTGPQARELALLLKSGSFVAPVTFEEERQVGPSLGEESIKRGLMSCLVGLGLIFLFSLYYYNLSGFFAFLALVFNILLILLGLARLGATLTLPGIAGLVLTVGMAIDAAILIFERIKEEIANGIDVRRAVNQGFSHAMGVILDGNITTFIIGLVLYQFGTGPIQGFAVTMMVGIVSTLITSLFFLRSLFTLFLNNIRVQKLRI